MEFTDEQQEAINKKIANERSKWEKEALQPIQKELEQTKAKLPHEPTDDEKALAEKQSELWRREVGVTLREKGLADFDGLITAKDEKELAAKIDKLEKIVNSYKIDNSYKPAAHGTGDEYAKAAQEHNTQSMIKTKLSKLFS
jgi:beta-lactamase superfamily II metal-dependent hydrolase